MGSTTARGYGWTHQTERKRWDIVVQAGNALCVRCGLLILPGSLWHLDHEDDGLGYLGPSHAACNLRAAAKLGNQRLRAKGALEDPPKRVQSREW